jgi:hypothetical protein
MDPDRTNAAQSSIARTPGQTVDQRFCIVTLVVPCGYRRTSLCLSQMDESFHAPLSSSGFNGAAQGLRKRLDRACFTDQGHSPGVCQVLDKSLILVCLISELMIEVHAHQISDTTLLFESHKHGQEGG